MKTPSNQRPRWGRKVIFYTILLIVLLLTFYWMVNKNQTQQVKNSDMANSTAVIVEKDEEKDIVYEKMEKLMECESSNNPLAINVRDKDGTASFGLAQYKPETFKEYGIKYGIIGEKASWNWIMTLIFDAKIQKKLTYEIIKNEPQTARKLWPVCAKRAGI